MSNFLKHIIALFVSLLEQEGHDAINQELAKHGLNVTPTDDIAAKDGKEPCPQGYVRNVHGVCVPDV